MASSTAVGVAKHHKSKKSKKAEKIPRPVLQHVPGVLRRAFLAIEISIEVDGVWLAAADAVAELPRPVFVLTAWNPYSKNPGRAANRLRNLELRTALVDQGAEVLPAVGASPDADWHEESLATVGITRSVARKLGRKFDQHAVFELRRTTQRVVGCRGGWSLARWFDEEVDIVPESGASLPHLLRDEFRLTTHAAIPEGSHHGWTSEGQLGVPCPKCGDGDLFLAGCDALQPNGTPFRATALVCLSEGRVMSPRDVPGKYRALVAIYRAFTTATADADQRGLVDNQYHAYVIELDDGVCIKGKPRVYVGVSTFNPAQRLEQHLSGVRAAKSVHKHRGHLRHDLMENQPPLRTDQEAKTYERLLFERLVIHGWPAKGGR